MPSLTKEHLRKLCAVAVHSSTRRWWTRSCRCLKNQSVTLELNSTAEQGGEKPSKGIRTKREPRYARLSFCMGAPEGVSSGKSSIGLGSSGGITLLSC